MRVMVIHNPEAGPARPRGGLVERAVAALRARGDQVEDRVTEHPHHATELAREAVEAGFDRVVVAGGDGSLNEAIQALAGSAVALTILPMGTTNVLAQELGIPLDPDGALSVLLSGTPVAMDLGVANGRYFSMMVGIGFDASVTMAMLPPLKKVAGMVAYTVAGLQAFFGHKSCRMRIKVDGRARRRLVYMMVISNTALYGPAWKITPDASPSDGLLDVCLFLARSALGAWVSFGRVVFGRSHEDPDVQLVRGKRVEVRTARPVPYQLDGDPVGHTPLKVEIRPLALQVVVPARG